MNNYFDFLPYELLELIIPYFTDEELKSFIKSFNEYKYSIAVAPMALSCDLRSLNWSNIFLIRFGYYKNADYLSYNIFLSVEKLKKLFFTKFKQFTLEQIYNLKKLELVNNQITIIPKEIGILINLEFLDLSNNRITVIPKEVGNLINLKELNLVNNQIRMIAFAIENLINLQVLDLHRNQITSIPKEIGNLRNLETLDLSSNQIRFMPEEIGNLINLKILYLPGNQFNQNEKNKIRTLLPNTKITF
jgi:hypothetical protein